LGRAENGIGADIGEEKPGAIARGIDGFNEHLVVCWNFPGADIDSQRHAGVVLLTDSR